MTPTLASIAQAIAKQLSSVVPPEFTVFESKGDVIVRLNDDPIGARSEFAMLASQHPVADGVEIATRNTLNMVQDYVSIATRRPWPSPRSATLQSPLPDADVHGSTLRFWYGDLQSPEIEFDSIDIDAL